MERDELGVLSREELLELVRRQQDALAEREASIERRDETIRVLEEELLLFRRPAKTPESSSVPPSWGQKAKRRQGGEALWTFRSKRSNRVRRHATVGRGGGHGS